MYFVECIGSKVTGSYYLMQNNYLLQNIAYIVLFLMQNLDESLLVDRENLEYINNLHDRNCLERKIRCNWNIHCSMLSYAQIRHKHASNGIEEG